MFEGAITDRIEGGGGKKREGEGRDISGELP